MLTVCVCQQYPRFQLGSLRRHKMRCNGFQPLRRFLLSDFLIRSITYFGIKCKLYFLKIIQEKMVFR